MSWVLLYMYIFEYSTIRSNWGSKLIANMAKQKRLRSNMAAESPPDDQKPKRAMASSPSRPKPEDSALSAASASRNLDDELASTIEEEESSHIVLLSDNEDEGGEEEEDEDDDDDDESCHNSTINILSRFSMVLHSYNMRIPENPYSEKIKDELGSLVMLAKSLESHIEADNPEVSPPSSVKHLHQSWTRLKPIVLRIIESSE